MDKKGISGIIILIILIVIVIGIIFLINYIKVNGNSNEKTIKCIAEKSKVIVSKTCSVCAYQKQILKKNLENYEDYFEIIDITEYPEVWRQYDLKGVPTWIINGKTYPGFQSIRKLKGLTGC